MKNNSNEPKFFMFYDTDRRNPHPVKGPYHSFDNQEIGEKYYHTLEDLLKTHYSESIKKRLISARIGTKIKLSIKFHSCGDLMIKCISKEETEYLDKLDVLCEQYNTARQSMYTIEKEINETFDLILKEERETMW